VLRPVEPGIKQILITVAPMILGLGFLQISELLNDVIAWVLSGMGSGTIHVLGLELTRPLDPGVIARVNAAQRLYQFPMGVLAMSLAGAVFPLLSRYAARNDLPSLRETLNRALRLAAMEGLAAGAALFALAEPLTRFLYIDLVRLLGRHGRFTLADAEASAFVLQMYAIGLVAYCTQTIFLRAFYARKDTLTPLKISCALVLLGPILVATLVWIPGLRAGAFGIAMTVTATANVIALAVVLRRSLGRFGGRQIAKSIARSALASAAMAAVIYLLRWQLTGCVNWLVVLTAVMGGAGTFLAVAAALRCPELNELLGRRRPQAADSTDYNEPGESSPS
ncbi:MAG: lipid II flippase MurJ, partial [Planctomycetota bacterium]